MPIEIPKAQERVGIQPAKVSTPQLSRQVPQAAFGGLTAEADQQLGEAVSKLGSAIAQRVIERQKLDEEQQVMSVHNEFSRSLQGSLYDPEQDTDGRPKGFLNRQLDHARGVTVDFDAHYAQKRQEFLDRVPTSRQRVALAARMDNDFNGARSSVIRHEADQGNERFKVEFNSTLERDPELAQSVLDAHRKGLPETMAAHLQTTIDGKRLTTEQAGLWDSMRSNDAFRLPDRNWNLAAMKDFVMGMDKPQVQKEQFWDYIRVSANEDLVNRTRADQANDRAFYNAALQAKAQGVPRSETLKLAGGFGAVDDYDISQRSEVLKRLYAPVVESDQGVYMDLWERAQSGDTNKREIDAAMRMYKINPSDWRSLRGDLYRSQLEGAPDRKAAVEQAMSSAEVVKKFSDKDARDRFKHSFEQQITEKGLRTRSEINLLLQENLKDVPTGVPGWFSPKTSAYWKSVEALHQNQEIIKAVGGTDFAVRLSQRIGGPDRLAPGTPESKAVMFILANTVRGKKVRPEDISRASIDATLGQHPELLEQEQ